MAKSETGFVSATGLWNARKEGKPSTLLYHNANTSEEYIQI